MTNTCPECQSALAPSATKCRCGWKASGNFRMKVTIACQAEGCRQPSLVRMPDGMCYCEFHHAQWWANNYTRYEPRVTKNAVCEAIRAEYQSRRATKRKLSDLGDALADKLAA